MWPISGYPRDVIEHGVRQDRNVICSQRPELFWFGCHPLSVSLSIAPTFFLLPSISLLGNTSQPPQTSDEMMLVKILWGNRERQAT